MATKYYNIRAKVVDVWHKTTTTMGNNVSWVKIETDTGNEMQGYTKPNAPIGIYITNSPFKKVCEITYHYTKSGHMVLDSAKSL